MNAATAVAAATAVTGRRGLAPGGAGAREHKQGETIGVRLPRYCRHHSARSTRRQKTTKLVCFRGVFNNRVALFSSSSSSSSSSSATNDNADERKDREEVEDIEERKEEEMEKNTPSTTNKTEENDVLVKISLSLIDFYRKELSPFMPKSCRFIPSCSNYAFEAYTKFGAGKGFILTAWRIARCNPFGGRGYDPPRWPPSFMK